MSEAADVYVHRMKKIILDLGKELGRPVKVADLGTGDFAIGRRLLEIDGMEYVGCDIVPELIEHHIATSRDRRASFQIKDIVKDELPDADVCLVRQVLQHLTNADVVTVLRKLRKYPYVYVTEGHPAVLDGPYNPDKPVGSGVRFDFQTGIGRGLEFDREPFNLRTEELFRVRSVPTEWVVTFRVYCSDWTGGTRPDVVSSGLD